MARTGHLEARLAVLEEEVARLKKTVESEHDVQKPWWEQIAGTFAKDALYEKAMALGRAHRRRSQSTTMPRKGMLKHGRARHRSS